jgi:hypothetical protein
MAQSQSSKSKRGARQSSGSARTKSTSAKTAGGARKNARSRKTPDNAAAAREAAAAGTRAAGKALAGVARQAKVPLVIGGAATAGLVGGLAVRARAKRSSRRFGGGLPLPMRDGKLDLEAIEAAAKRLSSVTNQIGEIAGAMRHDRPA